MLHHLDGCQRKGHSHHSETARDYYRQQYYDALDAFILAIEEKFNQESFRTYAQLESILLKAIGSKDTSGEIIYAKKAYNDDIDATSLETELLILQTIFRNHPVAITTFRDVIKHLESLPNHQ